MDTIMSKINNYKINIYEWQKNDKSTKSTYIVKNQENMTFGLCLKTGS